MKKRRMATSVTPRRQVRPNVSEMMIATSTPKRARSARVVDRDAAVLFKQRAAARLSNDVMVNEQRRQRLQWQRFITQRDQRDRGEGREGGYRTLDQAVRDVVQHMILFARAQPGSRRRTRTPVLPGNRAYGRPTRSLSATRSDWTDTLQTAPRRVASLLVRKPAYANSSAAQ